MKPRNPSSFRCLRDGMDETIKPRNHETYRLLAVPVDETMKPIVISMSRDWVQETTKPWNHETMKPIVISMSQRWSGRNYGFMWSGLWFHVEWSALRDKSWSHETMKPQVSFSKRAWFAFLGTLTGQLMELPKNNFMLALWECLFSRTSCPKTWNYNVQCDFPQILPCSNHRAIESSKCRVFAFIDQSDIAL